MEGIFDGSPFRQGRKGNAVVSVPLPESIGKADEAARKEILRALGEWLADESGYDEKVWPKLKKALEESRLSQRKRFRD